MKGEEGTIILMLNNLEYSDIWEVAEETHTNALLE